MGNGFNHPPPAQKKTKNKSLKSPPKSELMDIFEFLRLNKKMSDIYLIVPTDQNWCSQNFDFPSLKNLPPGQFFDSRRYH